MLRVAASRTEQISANELTQRCSQDGGRVAIQVAVGERTIGLVVAPTRATGAARPKEQQANDDKQPCEQHQKERRRRARARRV